MCIMLIPYVEILVYSRNTFWLKTIKLIVLITSQMFTFLFLLLQYFTLYKLHFCFCVVFITIIFIIIIIIITLFNSIMYSIFSMNTGHVTSLRNKMSIFTIIATTNFVTNIIDIFKEKLLSSSTAFHVTTVLCYLLNIFVIFYDILIIIMYNLFLFLFFVLTLAYN